MWHIHYQNDMINIWKGGRRGGRQNIVHEYEYFAISLQYGILAQDLWHREVEMVDKWDFCISANIQIGQMAATLDHIECVQRFTESNKKGVHIYHVWRRYYLRYHLPWHFCRVLRRHIIHWQTFRFCSRSIWCIEMCISGSGWSCFRSVEATNAILSKWNVDYCAVFHVQHCHSGLKTRIRE